MIAKKEKEKKGIRRLEGWYRVVTALFVGPAGL
jgi:hypothetical protein